MARQTVKTTTTTRTYRVPKNSTRARTPVKSSDGKIWRVKKK